MDTTENARRHLEDRVEAIEEILVALLDELGLRSSLRERLATEHRGEPRGERSDVLEAAIKALDKHL